ncbi:phosphonoacetaldehyde reductase [Lysinibacillus sp. LZ02]|uniref:phosphonoacetaldehyde reductase n=1 Tax=Lysinibacillus sp. LZ02 TaxID=3420668 RepID=UPI003D36CC75
MGTFFNPVTIHVEKLTVLQQVLDKMPLKAAKVLLLTRGGNFNDSSESAELKSCLQHYEVQQVDIEISNPTVDDLFALFNQTKEFDFDCIVGIGGGSVLDLSKSLAAIKGMLIESSEQLLTIIEQKDYVNNEQTTPWIGIPTTSGTGSELTCWATIWHKKQGIKLSIDHPSLYAYAAIIDYTLTASLPISITVSTALDALCHATEAYWSRKSNDISRVYAKEAIKRITQHLELLIETPNHLQYRREIALASMYAGLAFSNTRTTACHSISYPLTMELGVSHGVAASLTLAKVLAINFESIPEKQQLLEAFGHRTFDEIQQWIESVQERAGFATRLVQYKGTHESIDRIVENAFTKGRMDNNPVVLTETDVKNILISIYE